MAAPMPPGWTIALGVTLVLYVMLVLVLAYCPAAWSYWFIPAPSHAHPTSLLLDDYDDDDDDDVVIPIIIPEDIDEHQLRAAAAAYADAAVARRAASSSRGARLLIPLDQAPLCS